MAYTLGEIITMAQRRLVDLDDDAYLEDLPQYINEGIRKFSTDTHCCQAVENVTVTATDVINYSDMNNNTDVVIAVVGLDKAPVNESMHWDAVAETGTPTMFTLFAEQIVFNKSFTGSMRVWYTYIPEDLTNDSSQCQIQDEWIDAIVSYAEFCVRGADREGGLADRAWTLYETTRQSCTAKMQKELFGV